MGARVFLQKKKIFGYAATVHAKNWKIFSKIIYEPSKSSFTSKTSSSFVLSLQQMLIFITSSGDMTTTGAVKKGRERNFLMLLAWGSKNVQKLFSS